MHIAVLLDLDNIKPRLSTGEELCLSYGKVVDRRAFSNTPAVLAAYGGSFREFGYRFELTPGLEPMPQEVDTLIERTALEIVANSELQVKVIAVVSNDNDYASLFKQLKNKGIKTIVIGNQIGNKLRENADYVEVISEVLRPTYVGIDLGTTNTVMALANIAPGNGQQWTAAAIKVSVKDEQGSLVSKEIIPSSVRFNSREQAEVGGHIKAQAYAFRDQTILAWKHDMGASSEGKPFHYDLTSGKIAPEEAAAKILAFCREKLLQRHREVQGAVITHPASYESDAIEATRRAAVLAGWKEEEVVLLPEPHAALYDFLHRLQRGELEQPFDITQPTNLLVYDLGGGTLDVTLHSVQWDQTVNRFIIRDLAVGSRTRVGGDTVDQLIAEHILQNCPGYKELSSAEQKKLSYELTIYAEKFKKLWGAEYYDTSDKQDFKAPFQAIFLEGQLPIRYFVNSERMREILTSLLCNDLNLACVEAMDTQRAFDQPPFTDKFNSFVVPVLEIILKVRQSTGQIPKVEAVLLNGGMTYFPPVRECLTRLFGNTPIIDHGDPDLAVARGAALFAAGAQGRSAQRVNPTNIYLEVNEDGESKLRLLVAQGQTYPYRTVLKGFKLPNTSSGYLQFKAWVGMGTQPNRNTILQRLRQVAVEKILEAKLQPGCLLELEVEYTFDERLRLTIVSKESGGARFQLEVISDSEAPVSSPPQRLKSSIIIPSIPRTRTGRPVASGTQVNFQEWQTFASQINADPNSKELGQSCRELETKTVTASNRLELISQFLRWLQMSDETKTKLAVRVLEKLFRSFDSMDVKSSVLEKEFESWIKSKFKSGLANDLLGTIGLTPGRLLWSGWDDYLIAAFNSHQQRAQSEVFLNSLGKCGFPTSKILELLHSVIQSGQHMAPRAKAAWALARIVSPGQPKDWQANFTDVEKAAQLALEQLYHSATAPQVAVGLIGCLCQCTAWQSMGATLSQEICDRVKKLPQSHLAVYPNLPKFPTLERTFYQKLSLLPQMLELDRASPEDLTRIRELLLEVVKD